MQNVKCKLQNESQKSIAENASRRRKSLLLKSLRYGQAKVSTARGR